MKSFSLVSHDRCKRDGYMRFSIFRCWALRKELSRNFIYILFLYTRLRLGNDKMIPD